MKSIWEKISNKKLRVIDEYKLLFKTELSEFGKSKSDYGKFAAFYELYLFAFVIGYHSNTRYENLENRNLDTFNMIREWKIQPTTLFKNFLAAIITNKQLMEGIDFDLLKLSQVQDENEIDNYIKKLILIFEEYANGGFKILNEKIDSDPQFFDHFMALEKYHSDLINNSTS